MTIEISYDYFVVSLFATSDSLGGSTKTSAHQVTRAGHHCHTPNVMMGVSPAGIQASRLTDTSRLTTRVEAPHRFK
jgi:hypothetical protein